MAEEGEVKTYTQEDLDAAIAEANKGLEENRNKILDEMKRLQAQFEGISPKEYKEMKAKLAAAEQAGKAEAAGVDSEKLAEIRAQVRQDLEEEFQPIKSQNDALAKDNRELRLDNRVKSQMAKAGARPERLDALYKLTADQFDLTDDGQPMVKSRPGQDIAKYIQDSVVAEYPELFNGSGSSGGSAPVSKNPGRAGGRPKTIAADDNAAFIGDLEGLAAGTTKVEGFEG